MTRLFSPFLFVPIARHDHTKEPNGTEGAENGRGIQRRLIRAPSLIGGHDTARGGQAAPRRRRRRGCARGRCGGGGGGQEQRVPRAGGGPLQQPAQRGVLRQGRRGRRHGDRRRAGVRGRHEAADPRRRGVRQDRRRTLQDLRLRLRHRVLLRRYRMGQGQANGGSSSDQKHRDCEAPVSSTGKAPLQHAR